MRTALLIFTVVSAALTVVAAANAVREFSLAERLAMSDIVVVGSLDPSENQNDQAGKTPRTAVRVRVEYAIKGAPPSIDRRGQRARYA